MAVGLHPNYLGMLTGPNGSEPVKRLMGEMEDQLMNRSLDMSHVVEYLGRKALVRAGQLIDSPNERIALDASKDLMDRSSEFQKTTKLQVDSFSLSGQDVLALTKALTEAASVALEHEAAAGGLVEVNIETAPMSLPGPQAQGAAG